MSDAPEYARGRAVAPGVFFFVAYKLLGLVWTGGYLVLSSLFFPVVAEAGFGAEFASEVVWSVAELVLTAAGLVLVIRRHASSRRFWIVFLSLYCVAQLYGVFTSLEPAGAIFFVVTGLAWLAYWILGSGARELAFASYWFRPHPLAG